MSGFNNYAAGRKQYGGGRSMPTVGAVDKSGYRVRDLTQNTRKNAILRRLKAMQSGNYMQPDALRGLK